MIIAIIGATGLVEKEIKKILEEQNIKNIKKTIFVATNKNVGKKITFKNSPEKIVSITEALQSNPNYAIFSAGSETVKKYAKKFIKKGLVPNKK